MPGPGTSGKVLERNHQVLDYLEGIGPLPKYDPAMDWAGGPRAGGRGTDNQNAGAWAAEAARSAAAVFMEKNPRERDNWERARDNLLRVFFPRELETRGLWAREPMCPESHSHQHLQGSNMARVAAVVSGDCELLDASGELCRRTVAALKAVADPATLFVASAGTRFHVKGKPSWFSATAYLRQVCGYPGPLPEYVRRVENWRFGPGIAVRPVRYLQRRDDDLGGAAAVAPGGCPLWIGMTVQRWNGGHLAVMDRPKDGGGSVRGECIADWALATYGARSLRQWSAQVQYGRDWEVPVPPPGPKKKRLVVFGLGSDRRGARGPAAKEA